MYVQPVAFRRGEHAAQEFQITLLALDDVAVRTLSDQILVRDRGRQAVPVVNRQTRQIALDHAGVISLTHCIFLRLASRAFNAKHPRPLGDLGCLVVRNFYRPRKASGSIAEAASEAAEVATSRPDPNAAPGSSADTA